MKAQIESYKNTLSHLDQPKGYYVFSQLKVDKKVKGKGGFAD